MFLALYHEDDGAVGQVGVWPVQPEEVRGRRVTDAVHYINGDSIDHNSTEKNALTTTITQDIGKRITGASAVLKYHIF